MRILMALKDIDTIPAPLAVKAALMHTPILRIDLPVQ